MRPIVFLMAVLAVALAAFWLAHWRRRASEARRQSVERLRSTSCSSNRVSLSYQKETTFGVAPQMDHSGDALPYLAGYGRSSGLTLSKLDQLIEETEVPTHFEVFDSGLVPIPTEPSRRFTCPRCGDGFDALRDYQTHRRATCAEA